MVCLGVTFWIECVRHNGNVQPVAAVDIDVRKQPTASQSGTHWTVLVAVFPSDELYESPSP